MATPQHTGPDFPPPRQAAPDRERLGVPLPRLVLIGAIAAVVAIVVIWVTVAHPFLNPSSPLAARPEQSATSGAAYH